MRREQIDEFDSDNYSGEAVVEKKAVLTVRRSWDSPHPNLDAYDRHPHAIAHDISYDLDGWVLDDPSDWTMKMQAGPEDLLESARAAAKEWNHEARTLQVLERWESLDVMPDTAMAKAIEQLGKALQDGTARPVDHGERTRCDP